MEGFQTPLKLRQVDHLLYEQFCETARHYSRELNLSRRLLVTQSYAWFSSYGFILAGVLDHDLATICILTLLASLVTYFVGLIHRHHLGFVLTLIEPSIKKIEDGNGPWSELHAAWKAQKGLTKVLIRRPEVALIISYVIAAIATIAMDPKAPSGLLQVGP
jgi:hypothetical protein